MRDGNYRSKTAAPKADELTNCARQLVLVKKISREMQTYVNQNLLNKTLEQQYFALPIFGYTWNGRYFATVDLVSAFWHLELDENRID